jgi:hypothetical protein
VTKKGSGGAGGSGATEPTKGASGGYWSEAQLADVKGTTKHWEMKEYEYSWEYKNRGERVKILESITIWDRKTERVIVQDFDDFIDRPIGPLSVRVQNEYELWWRYAEEVHNAFTHFWRNDEDRPLSPEMSRMWDTVIHDQSRFEPDWVRGMHFTEPKYAPPTELERQCHEMMEMRREDTWKTARQEAKRAEAMLWVYEAIRSDSSS